MLFLAFSFIQSLEYHTILCILCWLMLEMDWTYIINSQPKSKMNYGFRIQFVCCVCVYLCFCLEFSFLLKWQTLTIKIANYTHTFIVRNPKLVRSMALERNSWHRHIQSGTKPIHTPKHSKQHINNSLHQTPNMVWGFSFIVFTFVLFCCFLRSGFLETAGSRGCCYLSCHSSI